MRSERERRVKILLAAVLVLGAGAAGCGHSAAKDGDEKAGGEIGGVAEVTLTKVEQSDLTEMLTITGTISAPPNRDVRVSAAVAGKIAELNVAEGDRVTAGQLLARIDDRPYRDQLRQAEAAEAQAAAGAENARLNRTRDEDLFQRGIASRKETEDARTQEKVAEAAARQAEAAVSLAKLQLARTEIHAPLAGIVVKRFASVGEQVDGTGAQPIVEVADTSAVEFLGNVPAGYLGRLRRGEALEIASEALPRKARAGRIVALSPAVDPATNAGVIRVRLENRDGSLRLGMALAAQVAIAKHRGALSVPRQAIYRDESGEPRVFHVEGEKATAVAVKLGIETPERAELLEGARAGETVILTGGYGLGGTAKIRVKGAAKETRKP